MSDFWAKHDINYRLFSQFCSPQDWHNILLAVASHLRWKEPAISRSLLDVGGGTGVNTTNLFEILYAQQNCRHFVTVLEPSAIARKRIPTNIVPETEGGFLRQVINGFTEVGSKKYDGILFLHSSYYINDFAHNLHQCIEQHLNPGGVALCLALSKDSPFFLGLTPTHTNLAEEVFRVAKDFGWRSDLVYLPSHFKIPESIQLADHVLKHLHSFICDGVDLKFQEFAVRFRQHLVSPNGDGVDLKDRLVVMRR